MKCWDADRINEEFIKRAKERNPERYFNKPKCEAFDELSQIETALHDINWHCAQNCWQKDKLIKFLDSIPPATFSNKSKVYVEAYKNEANIIKELILSNKLF